VKTYRTGTGEVRALQGITFDVPAAALTAVVGPSGSGKSSLLRLLAGIDRPTSGTLVVDGVRLHAAGGRTLRRLRRRTVRYVFQRPSDNFFPHLTVGEHLRVAARGAGGTAGSPQLEEVLDVLGIADRSGHLPSALSGGEQQRAAIAQALAGGGSIVVADEPTAELDSVSSVGVLEAIEALVDLGVTFVLATHDSAVVGSAHQVVRLDHGVLMSTPTAWRPPGAIRRGDAPSRATRSDPAGRPSPSTDRGGSREGALVLDVRGVSRSFRRGTEVVAAVRDATFALIEGELVGLLGRSGSGKTTLLNILSGWERADAGAVVRGHGEGPVPTWDEVAVLPQKLGLIEELTIRENIEYPVRLAGTLDENERPVDELVDGLGLRALQHRYPKETSVGEQQRTALARALVVSPRLLLADEPSAHQDRGWTHEVFGCLRRAVAQGTACLTATHSEEVVRYLDRVLEMLDGTLLEKSA
jgi:ABC-type lipoprotein export system ATPase subunit